MSIASNAICIPRIDASIPKTFIWTVFNNLKIGNIEGIIEIPFKDTPKFKRIIVKMRWNSSENATFFLTRFQSGLNVKLVYDRKSPWFWICVPNRLHCSAHSDTVASIPD
jgi:hypothetical protein